MLRIEVGRKHYILYLLLPHRRKVRLLSPASREALDEINRKAIRGDRVAAYEQLHRYDAGASGEAPHRSAVGQRDTDARWNSAPAPATSRPSSPGARRPSWPRSHERATRPGSSAADRRGGPAPARRPTAPRSGAAWARPAGPSRTPPAPRAPRPPPA